VSVKIMSWVWAEAPQTLSHVELLILLALADHANDDGIAWPSQTHLAVKSRCTRTSANKALARLTEMGLVEKVSPLGPTTPVWVYKINFGPQGVCSHDTGGVLSEHTEPSRNQEPLVTGGSTPPVTVPVALDETGFDSFWTEYPKKVDKGAARRAWSAAMKRKVDPQAIIEAAKRYTVETNGSAYVKNPATWLNAEAYDNPAVQTSSVSSLPSSRPAKDVLREMYADCRPVLSPETDENDPVVLRARAAARRASWDSSAAHYGDIGVGWAIS
jgi:hypothetical protein